MSPRTAAGRAALAIERRLRARLLPVVVLVVVSVSLTAPTALFVFRVREARYEAEQTARHAAALVEDAALESPTLWRYNTPKLVGHVRAFRARPGVRRILVVDGRGQPVDTGAAETVATPRSTGAWAVWASAVIGPPGAPLGTVWVAVSGAAAWRDAGLALVGFTLLGLALGGLVFSIPLRAARRAEARIGQLVRALDDSRRELEGLNADLERQVAERSAAVRDRERRLREVSSRAAAAQEAERRSIARELHDGVGQALTGARLQVQLLEGTLAGGARDTAGRTVSLIDEAIEEVRHAVHDLAPAILAERGLTHALGSWCDDFAERTGIALRKDIAVFPTAGEGALSSALETTCYRIAQEALTNVARHAGARHVEVTLRGERDRLVLTVRDDGRGLAGGPDAPARGRGLVNMRERAWLLGGDVEVSSAPGSGTCVTATLPRDDAPADGAAPAGEGAGLA